MSSKIVTSQNIISLYKQKYKFKQSQLENINWHALIYNLFNRLPKGFYLKFERYLNIYRRELLESNLIPKYDVEILITKLNIQNKLSEYDLESVLESFCLSSKSLKKIVLFAIKNKSNRLKDMMISYQKITINLFEKLNIEHKDFRYLFANKKLKFNLYNFLIKKFPNTTVTEISWYNLLSCKMIKLGMAYDAQHHPCPKSFDHWKLRGRCPYTIGGKRTLFFSESKKLWEPKLKTIKLPSERKMFEMFLKDAIVKDKKTLKTKVKL